MIIIGMKYLASGIVVGVTLCGVAIGVGLIFSNLILSVSRNPSLSNFYIRWSFITFSLVEVSGFISIIWAFLILFSF